MTHGSSAFAPFTDLPANRPIGPPVCRWRDILMDRETCGKPSSLRRGSLLLCEYHAKTVAEWVGFLRPDNAKRLHDESTQRELELLRTRCRKQAVEIERLKNPPRQQVAPIAVDGTIYFLRIGGYVKIGWTGDLEKRMKGYPPDSQILATMPGTRSDENRIHKRFAHLKTHGREWFPLAPQITEYVDIVILDHGEPPSMDFSAKRTARRPAPSLIKPSRRAG